VDNRTPWTVARVARLRVAVWMGLVADLDVATSNTSPLAPIRESNIFLGKTRSHDK
jgi:hypothetical protein